MANSRYDYVRFFELDDTLLRGCYIVIRIDGKGFTKCVSLDPIASRKLYRLDNKAAAARCCKSHTWPDDAT